MQFLILAQNISPTKVVLGGALLLAAVAALAVWAYMESQKRKAGTPPRKTPRVSPPPLPTDDTQVPETLNIVSDAEAFPGGSDDEPPPGALLWIQGMESRITNAPASTKWSCALQGMTLSATADVWQRELEEKTMENLEVAAEELEEEETPPTKTKRIRRTNKEGSK